MAVTGHRLTLEEFLALPEEKPALEYTDGSIDAKMSPNAWHSRLEMSLGMRLELGSGTTDPLIAFPEARITLGERSWVPDVTAYRASRVPVEANGEYPNHLTLPPDVAIEVTSPGQSIEDQDDRCRWLVENGVTIALRVNPRTRVVRMFRADGESDELRGADIVDLDAVAPGLRFSVDDLFGALRRPPLPQQAD
jgi:Uma2 family endonuclease